jgi:thiamine kinase-like enzyme
MQSILPVPELTSFDPDVPVLVMRGAAGQHGQELIEAGHGAAVLRLTGSTLRILQQAPTTAVKGLSGDGDVITHGDFGPHNMLYDLDRNVVTAVLDWEFAHRGFPVEDLAWAEWIVRMHHPTIIGSLPALFGDAGTTPDWADRHGAMLRRCEELCQHCEARDDENGAKQWRTRAEATASWTE